MSCPNCNQNLLNGVYYCDKAVNCTSFGGFGGFGLGFGSKETNQNALAHSPLRFSSPSKVD